MSFPDLEKNFRDVQTEIRSINSNCKLIVVTKEKPAEILTSLSKIGAVHIGENKMQGLADKHKFASDQNLSFEFHLIAPIQTNKIKLLNFPFHYHSATEIRHLEKMKSQNVQLKSCFIQVNISSDPQKSGIPLNMIEKILNEGKKIYPINGLMTILEDELSETEIRIHFSNLKKIAQQFHLPEVSMGMSNDYKIAAECGASFVRVGSKIVGSRNI